jgi:thiamine biosynthesis lipoprotein
VSAEAAPRRAWVEQVMGMPVSIHLRGQLGSSVDAEGRVEAAYDELRAVDVLFSPYREDSQVCRIDRGELAVRDAHPLVAEVVELARTARALTGGSFDAWRPGGDGLAHFDPTGLVKGWAVQRAAEHLAAGLGCDVSVTAGGDIALRPGQDPAPWRIGIEDPRDPARVLAVVPVVSGGVATSGTAHRGRHLVDPATGRATGDELLSVTVVGPSLIWADVLATAAFVRGAAGLDLVESVVGYEGLVVDRDGYRTTGGLTPQTRTTDISA